MLPLAGNMAAPQRLHEQIQLIGKSQVGELWAQIVRSRLATQAANLRHFDLNGALRLERLAGEVKPGDVSNAEAQGAKHYWKHFFFGSEFTREKEGAEDGLNARLNYGFAVLRALVARQLAMSGLNAGLGWVTAGRTIPSTWPTILLSHSDIWSSVTSVAWKICRVN